MVDPFPGYIFKKGGERVGHLEKGEGNTLVPKKNAFLFRGYKSC